MKKITYLIVASMMIALCSLQAQVNDTTGTASESRTDRERTESYNRRNQQQGDGMQQQRDGMQKQYSDRMSHEGMVVVEKNQLPSSLRQTLNDKKYAGWENATIYHNTTTGEYVIAPRAYRFDAQGKEIKSDNTAGHGNRMGGNDQYNQDKRSRQSNSGYSDRSTQDQNSQSGQTEGGQANPDQSSSQSDRSATSQSDQTSDMQQQPSSSYGADQATQSGDNQYLKEGMVEIQSQQIPAELRSTLSGSQYAGWEEGTLYQEPTTGEYLLVMEDGNGGANSSTTTTTTQARTYRFDKNGRLKSDQSTGTQNDR